MKIILDTDKNTGTSRQSGRSGTTAAKYIKLKGMLDIMKHTFRKVVRGA